MTPGPVAQECEINIADVRVTFHKLVHFEQVKVCTLVDDFKKQVPVRDYEDLKPYIERVLKGEPDILWTDKPAYFAKTSGTTSGTKYIPISKESASTHFISARNATLSYVHETLPFWMVT